MNSSGDEESSSSLRYGQSQLNAGFLSPLSSEKFSSKKDLGFSPSIFLSRPENSQVESMHDVSSNSPTSSSAPIPIPRPDSGSNYERTESRQAQCPRPWSSSPGYDSDGPQANTPSDNRSSSALNRSRDDFVTSTPIKVDKENLKRRNSSVAEQEGVALSPTLPVGSGRKHLREANDVSLWLFFLLKIVL